MTFSYESQDKVMNPEQFEEVVGAILSGKYSWACVLILRYAGYNPLHYIPYRTYHRLEKEQRRSAKSQANQIKTDSTDRQSSHSEGNKSSRLLKNISYIDSATTEAPEVIGGDRPQRLFSLSRLIDRIKFS